MTSEFPDTGTKIYEIKQFDNAGSVLASVEVEAGSGEAAAKRLKDVVAGADSIKVCLDGTAINEMGVDYWLKRVRRH